MNARVRNGGEQARGVFGGVDGIAGWHALNPSGLAPDSMQEFALWWNGCDFGACAEGAF